jgi:hypothetical protein
MFSFYRPDGKARHKARGKIVKHCSPGERCLADSQAIKIRIIEADTKVLYGSASHTCMYRFTPIKIDKVSPAEYYLPCDYWILTAS